MSAPMVRAILGGQKSQTRRIVSPANSVLNGFAARAADWERLDYEDAFVDPGPSPAGNPGPYLKVARPDDQTRHRVYPRWWLGDRLWVREAHSIVRETLDYETGGEFDAFEWEEIYGDPRKYLNGCARTGLRSGVYYPADGQDLCPSNMFPCLSIDGKVLLRKKEISWRPSIHMPRWASRLTLEITDIRAERLQDISEEDARAEGVEQVVRPPSWPVMYERRFWKGYENHQKANRDSARESFGSLWNSLHGPGAWSANPWVWAISFRAHRTNIDALPAQREAAE
ncbi:hypothetical protein [Rhizosaccharibacter radicis]|uniref:Morphogenetic protein n=1 Tax=Rhizosaccharibacter radicis TaxID=2782605 RepID=A0ABT1VXY4_9PROT|nr:hypothetical protein [Acetobacteraceae bacterium KSS12]